MLINTAQNANFDSICWEVLCFIRKWKKNDTIVSELVHQTVSCDKQKIIRECVIKKADFDMRTAMR